MQQLGELSFGPVPSFELASLDDPNTTLTPATFEGRVLLMDSWSTWSPQSVSHAFAEDAFQRDVAEAFGVRSLPKPVLVDRDGEVVAIGGQLRGERLLDVLSRLLSTN